jgi:hypothetical protein
MGLDARVYINLKRLPAAVDLKRVSVDSQTGEVVADTGQRFIALEKRLGNSARVQWLGERVAGALTQIPSSLLITRVLYSGTHSGDIIEAADLPQLQREIQMVRENTESDEVEVQRFLTDFEDLLRAAEEQLNPIVFV